MQAEKIEFKNPQDIIPYVNNAKIHDEKQINTIISSIREFGFTNPLLIDQDNNLIAGHGRLLAAEKMGLEYVPCRVIKGLTEAQRKALILADNKIAEMATWDTQLLETELDVLKEFDFDISIAGFDEQMPVETVPELNEDNFDIEDSVPEEPVAQPGDIYQLGNHRLMCGDSTDPECVKKLMDGALVDLLVTDPPYNVNYTGGTEEQLQMENDSMESSEFKAFLTSAFMNANASMKPGAGFYVWYASREVVNFSQALEDAGLGVRQELIWNKNCIVLGRQDYQWKHEPCLYGWKEGGPHYFIDDRTQRTVIEDEKPDLDRMTKEQLKDLLEDIYRDDRPMSVMNEDKPSRNSEHPTMKPLKLIARSIRNSSRPDGLVLDLFGGSGTTLICCEQMDRNCYMMEFDPHYVDVIINRWETYTGKKAVKLDGRTEG